MKAVFRCAATAVVFALAALPARSARAASDSPALAAGLAPSAAQPKPPRADESETLVSGARQAALAWLDAQTTDAALRQRARESWAGINDSGGEVPALDALARTFALVNPRASALVQLCERPRPEVRVMDQAWLAETALDPFLAHNLRLYYGRWLVHQEMFDEALAQFQGLKPSDVVAPATLLFYQGAAYHSLLNRDEGLAAVAALKNLAEKSPRRYLALARLMEEDLNNLEDGSLDHIARQMGDVRRRLDLGRPGEKTRDQQQEIVQSLDKIIKRIEDQQQGNGGQQTVQDSIRSQSPAQDSVPMGGRGPGEANRRDLGPAGDWGNLPPAEREQALQRVGRDFPSHYRDVIEQYFRRLAAEEKP